MEAVLFADQVDVGQLESTWNKLVEDVCEATDEKVMMTMLTANATQIIHDSKKDVNMYVFFLLSLCHKARHLPKVKALLAQSSSKFLYVLDRANEQTCELIATHAKQDTIEFTEEDEVPAKQFADLWRKGIHAHVHFIRTLWKTL